MNAPAFDLEGLPPRRPRSPEFDLGLSRPAKPQFDLPPIDLKRAWDLNILLDKAPVPTVEYAAWLQALRKFAQEAAPQDADLHTRLTQQLETLQAPVATICFGGHFKTGKSTLLNAALGRQVLPAADLPETGIICALRAGETDRVEVCDSHSRREIPCTLEAIQRETTLIDAKGERRSQVEQVDMLEIALSGCGIPPQARWLDSPGINDTEEMNACALRAARKADVLVWVLSSKQPLSEVEMEFLAAYIQERGPTAVVFILNAFLPENTPQAWETFLARKAPWIQDKVLYHAPDLGFTPEAPPHVAPVSGLGLFGDSENDFGRTELRALLLGLGSPEVPRIHRARLGRVARDLQTLQAESEERREKQRAEAEAAQQAREQARKVVEQRRPPFEKVFRQLVGVFFDQWNVAARQLTDALCETITGMSLARDDRYSRALNAAFADVAAGVTPGLIAEARRLASAWGQPATGAIDSEKLRQLFTPPPGSVAVANSAVSESAVQSAERMDGALRSMLQPLGIQVKPGLSAGLGATLGMNRETPEKRERDAMLTRQAVQEAAEKAIASLKERREEVASLLLHSSDPAAAGPEKPAIPCLSYRDRKQETLRQLIQQAERLAARDVNV